MTKMALSRDGHPVEVLYTYTEGDVEFAAVRYLDGHLPYDVGGRLAGTEDDPIWEHCVHDRETWTRWPGDGGTEKGLTFTYEVETNSSVNDEGSDFATVTITSMADGEVVVERFSHYFDDGPGPNAREQAASFLAAFEDSMLREAEADRLGCHPLELEFAPFGPAWQREQADRDDVPF
jgi:hypothetical protein